MLLIAILERKNLMDEELKWFDMFRIIFELVSAFGGIGLSLGVPYVSSRFLLAFESDTKVIAGQLFVLGWTAAFV